MSECVSRIIDEDAAVHDALRRAGPSISAFIEAAGRRFCAHARGGRDRAEDEEKTNEGSEAGRGGRLIYVGAGTSGRLGVLDASECPPTFQTDPSRVVGIIAGGDAALRRSSEGLEDDPNGARAELASLALTDSDTVLAIAAGGTTPFALGALAVAKSLAPGCLTGFLTCAPVVGKTGDPKGRGAGVGGEGDGGGGGEEGERVAAADHLIVLDTGPEVLTGSTRMKAGTATKMALNVISTTLMVRAGRVYENLMVDVRASNAKLRDRAARVVSMLTGLARDDAFVLLERAGGEAKTAVVMRRLGVTADAARECLARCDGRLHRVLDENATNGDRPRRSDGGSDTHAPKGTP